MNAPTRRSTVRRTALALVVAATVCAAAGCHRGKRHATAAVPAQRLPTETAAAKPEPATLPPATPLAFDKVITARRQVALTFDCCEDDKPAGFDQKIVSFLKTHEVPATFFLGGRWIEDHRAAAEGLAGVPFFELDNHSYLHPHMTKITAEQVRDELAKTEKLVAKVKGRPGRFFRPPFGEWNDLVRTEAARQGLAVVTWSVVTGDPDKHAYAGDIIAAVHKAKPGSVIIMHANGRGWHTAEALPGVLAWLKAHNLQPVTLAELAARGQPHPIQPKTPKPVAK
jgi:peptidoglycan-N-acetylglucosamine deacetylase